ncbi:hypothetical protein SLA2020_491050 [Shorea laevis]
MEPKSPSKLKVSFLGFAQLRRGLALSILVFVILLLSLGVYFAFNPIKSQNVLERSYFTVVVDCGSTGTRVNVYEWERRGFDILDLPILVRSLPDNLTKSPLWKKSCHYHCVQTEPGLHQFVGNATGVRASLEPLILWAEQWVPRERHRDTPIFILATAGLRRLTIEDSTWILDDIEDIVTNRTFMYKRSWIRILSGKEEAYYGWLALNYKLGNLGNSSKAYTSGLLDLGGSSLQVVVEVKDSRDDENLIRSKIGSINHQILAYSLPAFGLNAAFDRTMVMLSHVQRVRETDSDRVEIRHPCLSSDFVQTFTCNGCSIINVAGQQNAISEMHEKEPNSSYLVGDLNWEQCKRLVNAAAMNYSGSDWSQQTFGVNCDSDLSSHSGGNMLNPTEIAHHSRHFHALSGFFVVQNMLSLSPRASLTEIWETGEQLCSGSWTDSSSISEKQIYAGQYCFRLPYVASLLENSLCLGNSEIVFGPGDLSWTLGAALIEGEYLWLDTTKTHFTIPTLESIKILSSPVFLSVLFLLLLSLIFCSRNKLPIPGKKGFPAEVPLPSFVHSKQRPH